MAVWKGVIVDMVIPNEALPEVAATQLTLKADNRDAMIADMEVRLQSLQQKLEMAEAAKAIQIPPMPIVPAIIKPPMDPHFEPLLATGSHRLHDKSFMSEPDAFCNYMFRMQQNAIRVQQNEMQRSIERLEFENYMLQRQQYNSCNMQNNFKYPAGSFQGY